MSTSAIINYENCRIRYFITATQYFPKPIPVNLLLSELIHISGRLFRNSSRIGSLGMHATLKRPSSAVELAMCHTPAIACNANALFTLCVLLPQAEERVSCPRQRVIIRCNTIIPTETGA